MIKQSLLVSKVIYDALANDEDIKKAVGKRLYPIVAEQGSKFPFIVYKRESLTNNGCKDGYCADDVQFEVVIVSDKYSEGLNIANNVRRVLNRERISYNGIRLNDVEVISASEDFIDEAFVQRITFHTKVY